MIVPRPFGGMMQNRDLGILTATLTLLIAADGLMLPAVLIWSIFFHASYLRDLMPLMGYVGAAAILLKLVAAIVFCRWLYVAGHNLVLAGFEHLRFSPAKRITSFFVPIACFFMPFMGIRELWNASHGEPNLHYTPPLVTCWWTLWIIGGVLTMVVLYTDNAAGFMALTLLMIQWVVQGVVAIVMINRIANAQTRLNSEDVAAIFA